MKCNSIVLVKQVPDTSNISGEVMRPDGTVNRGKLPAIFNPDDRVALELALQLRDRFGGKVTAITMGPGKAGEFQVVTSKQLHQRLSKLKQQHSGDLYVKVIIPEESGLSYNEAWSFTFDILEQYDYYHQGS